MAVWAAAGGGGGGGGRGGSVPAHDLPVHLALPEWQRGRVVRDLLLDHTRLKVRTLRLEEIPAGTRHSWLMGHTVARNTEMIDNRKQNKTEIRTKIPQ